MTNFELKTKEEVKEWLEDNGISPDYSEKFDENEIDGAAFLELTESDVKDLVNPLGIVKKVIRLQQQIGIHSTGDNQQREPIVDTSPTPSTTSSLQLASPDHVSETSSSTYRTEVGIPKNFKIPESWRSEIMLCLANKQLTQKARGAMIRDLIVHMYSYCSRPSKEFCEFAARLMAEAAS
jgi:hypothetical protein